MTTQDLATRNGAAVQYRASSIGTERLGEILVRSGFFKDATDQAKAIVKVLAGQELALGPIASMTGIYIVEGKISLSAGLIAAAIQRSGRYAFRVGEWTEHACEITFYELGVGPVMGKGIQREKLGTATFSMADAQRAGLANKGVWKSYPKAMLWARAMSAGARAFCPEVFSGAIYTPEELGSEVDEEGVPLVIQAQPVNVQAPQRTHEVMDQEAPDPEDDPLLSARSNVAQRYAELIEEAARLDLPYDQIPLPAKRSVLLKKGEALAKAIATKKAALVTGIAQPAQEEVEF